MVGRAIPNGCERESERGCALLLRPQLERRTPAEREETTTGCSFAGWRRRRLRNCNLTLTPPYASALQQSIRPRILARRRVHPELRAFFRTRPSLLLALRVGGGVNSTARHHAPLSRARPAAQLWRQRYLRCCCVSCSFGTVDSLRPGGIKLIESLQTVMNFPLIIVSLIREIGSPINFRAAFNLIPLLD